MDWPNERYVRLYTKDTATWESWSWEARALFTFMLRKVDRSGVLDVGSRGVQGVSLVVKMPLAVVAAAMPELLTDDSVIERETAFVIPKFLEAQEAVASDAQRARESRARRRAKALGLDTAVRDPAKGPPVTKRDEPPGGASRNVTKRGPNVTPSCPSDPSVPPQEDTDGHTEDDVDGADSARQAGGWWPRPGGRAEKEIQRARKKGLDVDALLEGEVLAFLKLNRGKWETLRDPDAAFAAFLRSPRAWTRKAPTKRTPSEALTDEEWIAETLARRAELDAKHRARSLPDGVPVPDGEWYLVGGDDHLYEFEGRKPVGGFELASARGREVTERCDSLKLGDRLAFVPRPKRAA